MEHHQTAPNMRLLILYLVLAAILTTASGCSVQPALSASLPKKSITPVQTFSGAPTTVATFAPTAAATASAGSIERGKTIFAKGIKEAPPCSSCHAMTTGGFAIGPALGGVATRAETRRQGMTAEQYLTESILDPNAYIVPGYRGMMYPQYGTHYSALDVADLVAYLMTLK